MDSGARKRRMENLLKVAILVDSTAKYQVQHEGDSKSIWSCPHLITDESIQAIITDGSIVNVQIIINLIQK